MQTDRHGHLTGSKPNVNIPDIDRILLRHGVTAARLILVQVILVRIQVPQPFFYNDAPIV